MALERAFSRVVRRLPENDAIALASQKDKVIQLLHKELLAEGLLVVKGGRASTALASTKLLGVVASPQNDLSISAGIEALAELTCYNVDKAEAIGHLTGINNSGGEENLSQDNREVECEAVQSLPNTTKKFSFAPYAECLVLASIGKASECGKAVSKMPGPHSNGMEKEITEIPELLNRCKLKHTVSLAPFWVEGHGRLNDVWMDDDMVMHSKEFYLALVQDFFQECRTPGAVLYFTGLSQEGTGNWCFCDGVISLEEVLDLYQRFFKHRMLYIVADCSFSGQWVVQAVEFLDRLGIPPCGHHSLAQGVLLKVWATCKQLDRAQMLHGVREMMKISDDRVLVFYSREHRQLTMCSIDICCQSKMLNSCEGTPKMPSLRWSDRLRSSLIFLVRGKDKGRAAWHYVMVDEVKVNAFREQVASGNVDVANYGTVLCSGWGVDPPDDIRSQVSSFFP